MNALIIEDESPAARRLSNLIGEIDPKIHVIGIIESIEGAVKWISSNLPPDLFFMDIQLADGLSFEIFKKVKVKTPTIFTTAFDEYALKAFKVNSIDYLLKPIQEHELRQSLNKFKEVKSSSTFHDNTTVFEKLFLEYASNKKEYKTRFLVKMGERLISVADSEILFFKSEDKLSFIFTGNGNRYLIDYTLDQLEEMVDPKDFFRLNRQFIAHISSIESIHNYFNGKLKLYLRQKVREEVIVSREKAPAFKNWLGQ